MAGPIYQSLPPYTLPLSMVGPIYQSLPPFTSVLDPTLHATLGGTLLTVMHILGFFSSTTTPMEQAMAKIHAEMEAKIQQIPGVPTSLKKS